MSGSDSRPVRAAIYCRMSVAEMGDTEKVDRQEEDCRRVCDQRGWETTRVFVDNDRSAWQHNRKRKDWELMLEGVQAGLYDAIVVYHGDRLIRQPYDLEKLLSLASEKGIRLASPTGTRNLDSADDRFILRIEAAQACRESDNISRRVRRAKAAKREAGEWHLGRTRAFGRETDGSIREEEAALLRDVFARIAAGETQSSLWREWLTAGVPTVRGGQWWYTSFRQILRRADLAGLVSYRGQVVGEAVGLEPIIDRDLWETVQALLDRTASQYSSAAPPRKHLLSGLALCSGCDRPIHTGSMARSIRYRCAFPACPQPVSRNMQRLDEFVIGYVLTALADPQLWRRVAANAAASSQSKAGAAAELTALLQRQEELVLQFADDDTMDPALMRKMLARLDERVAEARSRIGAHRTAHALEGLEGLDRSGWDVLPLGRRRAAIKELVGIRLLPATPGPRFDVKAVKVWRADVGEG